MSIDALLTTQTVTSALVETLAGCLCAQLEEDGLPQTCFCGVIPGTAYPMDFGNCADGNGVAYVRVTGTYPSVEVGVAYIQPGNCQIGTGIDLELGIFRVFPLNEDGSPVDAEQMLEATRLHLADERAMRRALSCCGWLDSSDFVAGQFVPIGPAGGALGGTIPISAWIP